MVGQVCNTMPSRRSRRKSGKRSRRSSRPRQVRQKRNPHQYRGELSEKQIAGFLGELDGKFTEADLALFVQDAIPGIPPNELRLGLKGLYLYDEEGFGEVKKLRSRFEREKSKEILDLIETQRKQNESCNVM